MTEPCCDDAVGGDPLWPPLGRVVRVEGLLPVDATPCCAMPRLARIASRSSQATASRTAVSPASMIAPWTRGSSETAYSTLADFGSLNVRSNPGTRRAEVRSCVAVRVKTTGAGGESGEHGAQIVAVVRRRSGRVVRLPRRAIGRRIRRRRCSSRRGIGRPRTGGRPLGRHGVWRSTAWCTDAPHPAGDAAATPVHPWVVICAF